jgi:hypothetical protein
MLMSNSAPGKEHIAKVSKEDSVARLGFDNEPWGELG